jgi:putative membrane protein
MKRRQIKRLFKTRQIDETLIREHLALERTKLANERTILSYIRASLYLLIGGLALLQIKEYEHIKWLGYLSLFICVAFIGIGIIRYIALNRKLKKLLRPEDYPMEALKKDK